MGKAILICGKIGSGKTTYARKLAQELNAVMMGQDEIMLGLFGSELYTNNLPLYEKYSAWVQEYVKYKSAEAANAGATVICDNGFWSRAERDMLRKYYSGRGVVCEFHYMDTTEKQRLLNIQTRNEAVRQGDVSYYFTEDDIVHHFFEIPSDDEIDFRVKFEV